MNLPDICQDSLDGRSAHRKASTYRGQHNKENHGHYTHVLRDIRTHEASVRVVKHQTRHRLYDHCDK